MFGSDLTQQIRELLTPSTSNHAELSRMERLARLPSIEDILAMEGSQANLKLSDILHPNNHARE